MSTDGTPHASAKAHRAAAAAGPPAGAEYGAAVRLQVRGERVEGGRRVVTGRHPHAHFGPCDGDQRVGRLGHRRSVDAHDGDRRPGPQPCGQAAGADQVDAVEQAGVGAQLLFGQVRPGGLGADQAGHRDVAVGVVQGGQQPAQGRHGVRHRPAVHPAVHCVVQGPHLDGDRGPAAERRGQRGEVDRPVGRVGQHDHVGAEPVAVGRQELRQGGRADLLLALDQHAHLDRQPVAVGQDGGQMQGDAGLVVGGAAGEEPPGPLDRLEGIGLPRRAVAHRLYVVMGVQQDGRGTGRPGPATQHGRLPTVDGEHVDVGQSRPPQHVGHLVGTDSYLRRRGRVGRHRRDPDEALQVGPHRRQQAGHLRSQLRRPA